MTMSKKGAIPGLLGNLKCPEVTRVQLITNVDGTKTFILDQTGKANAEEQQRRTDARNKQEMADSVMKTAKAIHKSNMVLVNAAVEQSTSTRAKGMQTAMASFMGLEEDQLKDAKETHKDGMPTFAWLEGDGGIRKSRGKGSVQGL